MDATEVRDNEIPRQPDPAKWRLPRNRRLRVVEAVERHLARSARAVPTATFEPSYSEVFTNLHGMAPQWQISGNVNRGGP